jgi:hypothetical protein
MIEMLADSIEKQTRLSYLENRISELENAGHWYEN